MIDTPVTVENDVTTDEVVVLTSCGSEPEAALLVNTLRDCHIQAEMTGALTANFRADVPGFVRVLVRGNDLETAREILKEYNKEDSSRAIRSDDDDGNDEWEGSRRRRVKVFIGVTIMVVIVVYIALNSLILY